MDSSISLKIINIGKKKLQHFFNNIVFTRKKSIYSRCKQTQWQLVWKYMLGERLPRSAEFLLHVSGYHQALDLAGALGDMGIISAEVRCGKGGISTSCPWMSKAEFLLSAPWWKKKALSCLYIKNTHNDFHGCTSKKFTIHICEFHYFRIVLTRKPLTLGG